MMTPAPQRSLVLGFHPTARGFGWSVLESPFSVFDAGQFETRQKATKNTHCLAKLEWLLNRLQPESLVLEAFAKGTAQRSARIRKLCEGVVSLAEARGIEVAVYARADVHATFQPVGGGSRDEIAEIVLRQLPTLAVHYPGARKAWQGEDRRLSTFCASALVLTHYRVGANRVFEHLKDR
jgi:Holliday junction resolvasome RuvABC endonuclease subunit